MSGPTLVELLERVREIEPWLERRIWPPMTYMLIPGVLRRADELIRALSFIAPNSAPAREALTRVLTLRADFRRER